MKTSLLPLLVVGLCLASCARSSSTNATATTAEATSKIDSPSIAMDSSVVMIDSPAPMVDSLAVKSAEEDEDLPDFMKGIERPRVPESKFRIEDNSGYESLLDKDIYFRPTKRTPRTQLTRQLADVANGFIILDALCSDSFLYGERTIKMMKQLRFDVIQDKRIRERAKSYCQKASVAISRVDDNSTDNPFEVTNEVIPYYKKFRNWLIKEYHVDKFGRFSKAEFDRLHNKERHIKDFKTLVGQREEKDYAATIARRLTASDSLSIDQRSILLLEYLTGADITRSGSSLLHYEACDLVEDLIRQRIYTVYLVNLWLDWRATMQVFNGGSIHSEKPDFYYNQVRNICLQTILEHIGRNPKDIMAIDLFLELAWMPNLR